MKVVLFNHNHYMMKDLSLKYLTVKKRNFWLYVYNSTQECFLKTNLENVNTGDSRLLLFISVKDVGDFFKANEIPMIHGYQPIIGIIRYDEDIIRIIEENPNRYFELAKVCEIPTGAKYRIIKGNGYDELELESDADWLIAK